MSRNQQKTQRIKRTFGPCIQRALECALLNPGQLVVVGFLRKAPAQMLLKTMLHEHKENMHLMYSFNDKNCYFICYMQPKKRLQRP